MIYFLILNNFMVPISRPVYSLCIITMSAFPITSPEDQSPSPHASRLPNNHPAESFLRQSPDFIFNDLPQSLDSKPISPVISCTVI